MSKMIIEIVQTAHYTARNTELQVTNKEMITNGRTGSMDPKQILTQTIKTKHSVQLPSPKKSSQIAVIRYTTYWCAGSSGSLRCRAPPGRLYSGYMVPPFEAKREWKARSNSNLALRSCWNDEFPLPDCGKEPGGRADMIDVSCCIHVSVRSSSE
jgi:hypothetical protein